MPDPSNNFLGLVEDFLGSILPKNDDKNSPPLYSAPRVNSTGVEQPELADKRAQAAAAAAAVVEKVKAEAQARAQARAEAPARTRKPAFFPGLSNADTSLEKPQLSDEQKLQYEIILAHSQKIGSKILNLQIQIRSVELYGSNQNKVLQTDIQKLQKEQKRLLSVLDDPKKYHQEIEKIKSDEVVAEKLNREKEEATKIQAELRRAEEAKKIQAELRGAEEAKLHLEAVKLAKDALKKTIDSELQSAYKSREDAIRISQLKSAKELLAKNNPNVGNALEEKKSEVSPNVADFLSNRSKENNEILRLLKPDKVDGPLIGDRFLNSRVSRFGLYVVKLFATSALALATIPLVPFAPFVLIALKDNEIKLLGEGISNMIPKLKEPDQLESSTRQVFEGAKEGSILKVAGVGEFNSLISGSGNYTNEAIRGDESKIKDLEQEINLLKEAKEKNTKEALSKDIIEKERQIDVLKTTIKLREELIKADENIKLVKKAEEEETDLIKKNGGGKYLDDKAESGGGLAKSFSFSSIRRSLSTALPRSKSLDSGKDEKEKSIIEKITIISVKYNEMLKELKKQRTEINDHIENLSIVKAKIISPTIEEKNIEILKELLNIETKNPAEVEARKNLILEKYNEIVNGGIPTADPGANSVQREDGTLYIATKQKVPRISSEADQVLAKKRKEGLMGKLDGNQQKQLESIITENNKSSKGQNIWVGRAGGGGRPAGGGGR